MFGRQARAIRKQIEAELDRVVRACPGWRALYRPPGIWLSIGLRARSSREGHDKWLIDHTSSDGWYVLEVDSAKAELVIWYGQYQAGPDVLITSIFAPAVHIPFVEVGISTQESSEFTLGDVLQCVILDQGERTPSGICFPPNRLSLT
jgi:hypothetical protein